ncbi:Na-translocating system protein MpsC family protein [Brevibacillus fluminis]|uniref:Na-translocating system protein MpsC family protein n=1 Tax=Brevibacillus fluminis TaxID=511487 RepID=UPI003F88BE5E
MNKTRVTLEREVSNFISYYIKETLGRGPRDTEIKITDNVLIFFIKGILTQMEKNILKTPEGKNIVLKGRQLFVESTNDEYIKTFEKIVESKVIQNYEAWDLENDSAVGVLVFEKKIC